MKATAARRISYSVVVTAGSACLLARLAHAQVAPIAAAGVVTTAPAEPAPFQGQTHENQPDPATSDTGPSAPFLHRYKPQAKLWEVGVFLGPSFLELSQQRAEAVKAQLVAKGIDASRIESKGAGPDEPLTTNDTQAGRQKNRRIEFHVRQ